MKESCILLLSDHEYLSTAAEDYARLLFDVIAVARHPRSAKRLAPEILEAFDRRPAYLFNFLSPVIIKESELQKVGKQAINFHPAPPEWPGVGSASLALYRGDTDFGATVHEIISQIDAGPILGVRRFPIVPGDTCETLFSRALHASLELFYVSLTELFYLNGMRECSWYSWQRHAITRQEFEDFMRINPGDSPEEIQRKARALSHSKFPGLKLTLGGIEFEQPPRKHYSPNQLGTYARAIHTSNAPLVPGPFETLAIVNVFPSFVFKMYGLACSPPMMRFTTAIGTSRASGGFSRSSCKLWTISTGISSSVKCTSRCNMACFALICACVGAFGPFG
jgi:hypothetical protein